MEDHEVLNRISERLFGYREASNKEIISKIDDLIRMEQTIKLDEAIKVKSATLLRIAKEINQLVEEA